MGNPVCLPAPIQCHSMSAARLRCVEAGWPRASSSSACARPESCAPPAGCIVCVCVCGWVSVCVRACVCERVQIGHANRASHIMLRGGVSSVIKQQDASVYMCVCVLCTCTGTMLTVCVRNASHLSCFLLQAFLPHPSCEASSLCASHQCLITPLFNFSAWGEPLQPKNRGV